MFMIVSEMGSHCILYTRRLRLSLAFFTSSGSLESHASILTDHSWRIVMLTSKKDVFASKSLNPELPTIDSSRHQGVV